MLHAAGLRRLERPVDDAFTDRNLFLRLRRPVLEVHREEPARILGHVIRSFVAQADQGHLELHLHQLGVELLHELVVDQRPVQGFEFHVVVVISEIQAGRVHPFGDLVSVPGRPRPVGQRRIPVQPKRRQHHLRKPELFRKRDAIVNAILQLLKTEMTGAQPRPAS